MYEMYRNTKELEITIGNTKELERHRVLLLLLALNAVLGFSLVFPTFHRVLLVLYCFPCFFPRSIVFLKGGRVGDRSVTKWVVGWVHGRITTVMREQIKKHSLKSESGEQVLSASRLSTGYIYFSLRCLEAVIIILGLVESAIVDN